MISLFQGTPTTHCAGQFYGLPAGLNNQQDPALNVANNNLKAHQYHFFQFSNLVIGRNYAVFFSQTPFMPNIYVDPTISYPTQFNCKDVITQKNPPFSFSVINAKSNFLSLGLTSPNAITFTIQTYLTDSVTFNMGNPTQAVTLQPSQLAFYALPLGLNGPVTIRLTGNNVPLNILSSPTSNPATPWDITPAHVTPVNANQMDTVIPAGDLFTAVQNPTTNANAVIVTAMLPALPTTATGTTNGLPITTQTAVLALTIPAIIGISVGIFVFILIVIGGIWIYSKKKSKKQGEYKQVQQNPSSQNQKEKSTTSSDDDTETEEEEDDDDEEDDQNDYDSYPPPRRSSRGPRGGSSRGSPAYRGPNRGPSRSRERSYSDDDDEDDYSSDDYS